MNKRKPIYKKLKDYFKRALLKYGCLIIIISFLLLVGLFIKVMTLQDENKENYGAGIPTKTSPTLLIYCHNLLENGSYTNYNYWDILIFERCYELENGNLSLSYENEKWKKLGVCFKLGNKLIGDCGDLI